VTKETGVLSSLRSLAFQRELDEEFFRFEPDKQQGAKAKANRQFQTRQEIQAKEFPQRRHIDQQDCSPVVTSTATQMYGFERGFSWIVRRVSERAAKACPIWDKQRVVNTSVFQVAGSRG